MPLWLYAAACLAVPALWGVVMYHLFNAFGRRRDKYKSDGPPPIDYSI